MFVLNSFLHKYPLKINFEYKIMTPHLLRFFEKSRFRFGTLKFQMFEIRKTRSKSAFRIETVSAQYSIFFRCGQNAPYRDTNRHTYLQVKIGISSTGCSPHVDFDNFSRLKQNWVRNGRMCLGVYMLEVWNGEEKSAKNLT